MTVLLQICSHFTISSQQSTIAFDACRLVRENANVGTGCHGSFSMVISPSEGCYLLIAS